MNLGQAFDLDLGRISFERAMRGDVPPDGHVPVAPTVRVHFGSEAKILAATRVPKASPGMARDRREYMAAYLRMRRAQDRNYGK